VYGLRTAFGWGELSHEHFGLKGFGASGREFGWHAHVQQRVLISSRPLHSTTAYNKVYEKFDVTPAGIAARAEKVVAFYKKRGHPVYSPLISALSEVNDEE
jgi:transketolase